jgi:hypothetical protein
VTSDRARGAVLYAGAALLLVAGGAWWVRAKPRPAVDPVLARWSATAERLLPDPPEAETVETIELRRGVHRQVDAPIDTGAQGISMVCVGEPKSVVRVSLGVVDDSGRPVHCTGAEPPTRFEVGLVGQLHMDLSLDGAGPVVFRYSVVKLNS